MADGYIPDAMLREVALTREEYDTIVAGLGRPPNAVELGMFGAMWSEHCGYKSSKPLLGRIPTVGGETYFHPCYSGNPLVNAMCVGVIDQCDLTRATSGQPGNLVLLVGAATGRDGVHGATFASVELTAESEERRSAVQVGDPFMEKLLLEACIELCRAGAVVGMQDLGAAGLTSSGVEVAARGGHG